MNRKLRGYLSIIAAALFWGTSATAAKSLFERSVSPLLLVESRVILATVFLLLLFWIVRPRLLRIRLADMRDFALLGIIGVAGSNYSYYMAIQETSVGIAILMQYTAPTLVAIYMVLTRQERISRTKILALLSSLGGCIIMVGAFDPAIHLTPPGIALGALSAVCFAFFNVYTKVASKRYSIWTALTYTFISASIFWIALDVVFHTGISVSSPREMGALVLFSLSSALIPYFFYFNGLKFLTSSTAIIVSTLEPVIAIFSAFVILGETLYPEQIAGGVLVISAVILLENRKE
ncbi:MAG: DMT family transporter [Bacteroidetes bacterium]|nr:DMT family transporter [Bacteroidota bacterium]